MTTKASFRDELRQQIIELIEPWKDNDDKPPFPLQDLVAMAFTCSDCPLSKAETVTWLANNLRYYNTVASDIVGMVVNGGDIYQLDVQHIVRRFVEDLSAVFLSYHTPLVAESYGGLSRPELDKSGMLQVTDRLDESDGPDEYNESGELDDSDEFEESDESDDESEISGSGEDPEPDDMHQTLGNLRWTVPANEAAVHLQRYFYPLASTPPPSRSHLLEITTELREIIFAMALRFPILVFHSDHAGRTLHALKHNGFDSDDLNDFRHCKQSGTRIAAGNIGKLSHALALLQVSKQCFNEGLPLFYQINTIFLSDINSIDSFGRNLPTSHLHHLTNLAIAIFVGDGSAGRRLAHHIVRLGLSSPSLRKLSLRFDQARFYKGRNVTGTLTWDNTPVLKTLARLRGLQEVKVYGKVEMKAVRRLRAAVMKPREEGGGLIDGNDAVVLKQ